MNEEQFKQRTKISMIVASIKTIRQKQNGYNPKLRSIARSKATRQPKI